MARRANTANSRSDDAQGSLWDVRWRSLPGPEAVADDALLGACVELFAAHYGTWGDGGPNPGGPVRISRHHLRELLEDANAHLACAYIGELLVGYCVASRHIEIPGSGSVDWVSQLVVHATYRKARIATKLLYSVWQFSDSYAWGLVTASPFAVRALETATRRACSSAMIVQRSPIVLGAVRRHVRYLPHHPVMIEGKPRPSVNTEFHVDHSDVPVMQRRAARHDRPWALGDLAEGHEWLAVTFKDQAPRALDDEHLAELLTGADGIWIQAYEGMTLDSLHTWHQHHAQEIDVVLSLTQPSSGATIIDVGCGDGRHVEVLAHRGFNAYGIDISERLIARARERVPVAAEKLLQADARNGIPVTDAELVIALYDVVGSSARADDDLRLVRATRDVLVPGGRLALSVMNAEATLGLLPKGRRPQSNTEFVEALEALPPSRTMETSGAVFDPAYLLEYQGVFYRKEQFEAFDDALPAELVVRDRRFTVESVSQLLDAAGFSVDLVRPVQAGGWAREPALDPLDTRAKELLVLATRRD